MDGRPGAFEELEKFVRAHRECGSLIGDAGRPGADGYLLWVSCSCDTLLERWVTPEAAAHGLVWSWSAPIVLLTGRR